MPLFYNDYCRYLLALLIPYALMHWKNNANAILLVLFSIIYTGAFYLRGEYLSASALIYYLIYPTTLYIVGFSLCKKFKDAATSAWIIILLAISLAFPAIYYNLIDFSDSGQLIRVGRNLSFGEEETKRTATGYGMMMSLALGLLGLVFCISNEKSDRNLKFIAVITSFVALFCTVRLLNRTGLVIAAISCIIAVLSLGISTKRLSYLFVAIIALSTGILYLNEHSPLIADAIENYTRRNSGVGAVEGFGGRDERWMSAIIQIFNKPTGDIGLDMGGFYNYAHNLWLDVGIRGGLISLIILIFVTFNFIQRNWIVYRYGGVSKFNRQVFLLIGIAFLLQLSTEPIIEGLPQFFWLWLFFLGILDAFPCNIKHRN